MGASKSDARHSTADHHSAALVAAHDAGGTIAHHHGVETRQGDAMGLQIQRRASADRGPARTVTPTG
ncbi:MAG: hypothetical protein R3A48_18320 [Polyangiales bacterium]